MFKKRETPVQNIAYIAIMAAINVIFVLLTAVLPPLMFLLIFILPLASTVVTIFCKKIYFPIYFVVTIGLCLLASFGIYIYDTFFYVIPSLITGFIFGIMIEKKAEAIHILTCTTAAQYLLIYLSFFILNNVVTHIDFIDSLLKMFGLENFEFKYIFTHVFCFLIAGIQILFTFIIIKFEIKKLGMSINLNCEYKSIMTIISIVLVAFAVGMYFVYPPLTYIFIFISLYYFVYECIDLLISQKSIYYVILGVIVLSSIFLFALLYKYPVKPLSIVLLAIPVGLVNCFYFVNYCLTKKQNYIK